MEQTSSTSSSSTMQTSNNGNSSTQQSSMMSSSSQNYSSTSGASTGKTSNNRVPVTLRDTFFQDPFFSSSWDDFDKIREDMMKQTQQFWSRIETSAPATPAAALPALTPEADGGLSPLVIPRRWMFPRLFSRDESTTAHAEVETIKNDAFPADFFKSANKVSDEQTIRLKDSEDKMEISLDTHQYRPDEIKVNVINGGKDLVVEAKHEEKDDDAGKYVARQFSRRYGLPQGVEADKVHCNLSSDGVLMVVVPKKPALKADEQKSIPIEQK